MLHALRYYLRRLWDRFLDRGDIIDHKAVKQCYVSAEPMKQQKLNVR